MASDLYPPGRSLLADLTAVRDGTWDTLDDRTVERLAELALVTGSQADAAGLILTLLGRTVLTHVIDFENLNRMVDLTIAAMARPPKEPPSTKEPDHG
jgi:hypothetical protein